MKKQVLALLIGIAISTFGSNGMINSSERLTAGNNEPETLNYQQQKADTPVKQEYTCSMHPEVIQDKPGKCPKCGMTLVLKEVKKDVYTCPMHSEITQDKPGKCPKCGMNLEKKEAPKKTETVKK